MIKDEKLLSIMKEIAAYGDEAYIQKHSVKEDTLRRYKSLIAHSSITQPKPKLRLLVLDIETSLIEATTFQVWKTNIMPQNITKDWAMLSWSAKWLNEPEVYGERVTSDEAIEGTDASIMDNLFILLDEADVVITHNGMKFDIPRINTRLILNKFPKPSPFRQIDTLQVSRKNFGFTHNKLDAILDVFNLKGKTGTNMQLWIDCGNGNEQALDDMLMYNENDVVILENLYHELKGWIPSHPRMYSDTNGETCEVCGSNAIVSSGKYATMVNEYESFSCNDCGAVLRKRSTKSEELVVVAR